MRRSCGLRGRLCAPALILLLAVVPAGCTTVGSSGTAPRAVSAERTGPPPVRAAMAQRPAASSRMMTIGAGY